MGPISFYSSLWMLLVRKSPYWFFLSLCVLMGSYASLWVIMGLFGYLCVLLHPFWVLMRPNGPIGSLYVLMRPYWALWVLISSFASLCVLMVLIGLYAFLWVL